MIRGPLYDPSPLLIHTYSWITGYVYKAEAGSGLAMGGDWASQFKVELQSQGVSNIQTDGRLIIGTFGKFNIEMGLASRYSSEYANSTDTYALGYWIQKRC